MDWIELFASIPQRVRDFANAVERIFRRLE
jgi:hypothetical protein